MIILEQGETLLATARKHWITYVSLVISHALTFLIIAAVLFFVQTKVSVLIVASLLWITSTSFVWFFITQYLDIWYITDKRIIAINQIELFSRTEAIILMSKVQDTQFKKLGVVEELLGYGSLIVQSAGIDQEFVIESVSDVENLAQIIIEQKAKHGQGQGAV